MSKRPRHKNTRLEESINDIRFRQRNIVWPDVIVNANRVNRFLFKGARNAPVVQRIGALLFGIVLAGSGIVNLSLDYKVGTLVGSIVSFTIIGVGVIFCVNAVRGWRLKSDRNK
jgi:hypothetical protein